ncbi:hypothetical protein ACGF0J_14065 [Nonomuraea sp. NPDC047897]|uniref:hypothetical protein n=1 Tax=Nonomuraea sp. NPDC047897 TaxID=3364346 RepID=UPI00371D8334
MPIRPENRDRYPADWPQISHRIRFDRAAGRCECAGECGHDHDGRCTALHGEAHPVTDSRVVLTTAHRDHVPENCADENLFAAFQRCHLAYDREHHAQTRRAAKRKRSGSVAIGALAALSALVMAGCASTEETVTADCVDTTTIAADGSYQTVDDRFCDGGSHASYVYVYGGSYSGGRVHGATTIRPKDVGINTRSGKTIVRSGFGSSGKGGGGG